MRRAHDIEFCTYLLRSKRMVRALEFAAQRGSRVRVQLEAHPYADTDGKLATINRDAVAELRAAGVNARLVDRAGDRPNHMKAAVIDGVAFLDDRNWPADQRNAVVADDNVGDVRELHEALHGKVTGDGELAVTKGRALAQETGVLLEARHTRRGVCVETESFSAGAGPYAAIKALALSRAHVRLLISANDCKKTTMFAARSLARDGVEVRLTHAAEKFAVAGDRAWVGSANATYGRADQLDWGVRVDNARLRRQLQDRFDLTWRYASPVMA